MIYAINKNSNLILPFFDLPVSSFDNPIRKKENLETMKLKLQPSKDQIKNHALNSS